MLLDTNNTKIREIFQQYSCTEFSFERNNKETWLNFTSLQKTENVCCQYCGAENVEVHDNYTTVLKDMPIFFQISNYASVVHHKYK